MIVKVGGSLYDWPRLGERLGAWMHVHRPAILVPGGGQFVERIRSLALDEESAHWEALRAMNQAGRYLRNKLSDCNTTILDAHAFCRGDAALAGALPHSWDVTSDSVAARAAELLGAELILLKSADPPQGDFADWSAAGYVDRYFPRVVGRAALVVQAVNLRAW